MRETCPICKLYQLVPPVGPPDSPVLLFGPYPGYIEEKTGVPWSGPAGKIFRKELHRVGVSYTACRVTNLWLHHKPKAGTKKNPNEMFHKCFDWCFGELRKELTDKKLVVVMGSETCQLFFDTNIMHISGCVVQSPYISKDTTVMALINPAIVESTTVGELRLGIERFAELARGVL